MGGKGSGRRRSHVPRPLVEDALPLDLRQEGLKTVLALPEESVATIAWTDGSKSLLAASLQVGPEASDHRVLTIEREDADPQVLQLVRVQIGCASRWLFECPGGCERRARG